MAESGSEDIRVPIVWEGLDELPIHASNQILSQFTEDGFIVSFGILAPPALIGSDEERREQAQRLGYLPIRPIARVSLSEQRLQQFIEVLQQNLQRFRDSKEG